MTRPRYAKKCGRDECGNKVIRRDLCLKHFKAAYPPELRGFVDSARAREHVAALRARGATQDMLAKQGLFPSVVRRIEKGEQRIQKMTETRALAISLDPNVWVPSLAIVDATGTVRRLQALARIGYTQNYIGERLCVTQKFVSDLLHRQRVSGKNAAAIAALFTELETTPGPSELCAFYAARKGWAPAFAWDEDTIDNPSAQPHIDPDPYVSSIELYRELREIGVPDAQAPARLGIRARSLTRQLLRHGVPVSDALASLAQQERSLAGAVAS